MESFPFNYIYACVRKHMYMAQHICKHTTSRFSTSTLCPRDKAWVTRLGGRSFLAEPSLRLLMLEEWLGLEDTP